MKSLIIFSPAKTNLFLKVLGKRPDGFHELLTVFHRLSLCDRLILKKLPVGQFSLTANHPALRKKKDNLISKAYDLLRRYTPWKGGVAVKLEKNIPVAAGLGGGSSNAAHFLLGMNRLFNLGLPLKTLVRLGAELGSDVAFFLYDVNQAIGTGRGEKINPFSSRHKFWFVLAISRFGISTALVYQRLKARALTRISHDATITSAFLSRNRDGFPLLWNDLFPISSHIKPELKRIDALFDQFGVARRLMSGSGPTMFSIHKSKREAQRVAQAFRRRSRGTNVFVCQTY